MSAKLFRPLLIALILTTIYTIWAVVADATHSLMYHLSGGLFIAGFLLLAIGFFLICLLMDFLKGSLQVSKSNVKQNYAKSTVIITKTRMKKVNSWKQNKNGLPTGQFRISPVVLSASSFHCFCRSFD
ncbi:hypothetical protein [Exiguobacterium artemiae]